MPDGDRGWPALGLHGDRRGASTTLTYALNLALAAILVSVLLFGAGSVVEDERQSVAREELTVLGERIAATLQQADRMAAVTPPGRSDTLRLTLSPPPRVAGSDYTVTLDSSTGTGDPVLILQTETPEVRVRITVPTTTPVEAATIDGGPLVVVNTSDGLEVRER